MRAFVCGLVVLIASLAAQATVEDPEPVVGIGRVVAIDATAGTLTVSLEDVEDEPREITLSVDAQTKIEKDGHPIVLGDVERGDHAVVSYRTVAGENVATTIAIETKPPA